MAHTTNVNSPAVKRIFKELKELHETPSTLFKAQPLDDNIFEIHFTIRGPRDTEFQGGVYHGKILLPEEYPLKPPDIVFLTPNGRFEVGKKICLTISSHHAETWRPSWSIRTAILAIIGFMPTAGDGAIASLDWPKSERQKLARLSVTWQCPKCESSNLTALPAEDSCETLDTSVITEMRIKNKEEQERDEREKQARLKSQEAASAQPSLQPVQTTSLTQTHGSTQTHGATQTHGSTQTHASNNSNNSPHGSTQTHGTTQTHGPTQTHTEGHFPGLHQRVPPPRGGTIHAPVLQPVQAPRQPSLCAQYLDIFIVVVFFVVVGLVMKKFALF